MSGAMDSSDQGSSWTRWTIKECVFPDSCSKQSWDRAKVVSWESEEDCREKLMNHLVRSDKHWGELRDYGEDGLRSLVSSAPVEEEIVIYSEKDMADWHEWNSGKSKQQSGQKRKAGDGMSAADKDEIADRVAEKLARPRPTTSSAASGSGGPSTLALLDLNSEVDNAKKVVVSIGELRALQDDARRCARAVKQRKVFLEQGAAAFGEEVTAFNSCVEAVGVET